MYLFKQVGFWREWKDTNINAYLLSSRFVLRVLFTLVNLLFIILPWGRYYSFIFYTRSPYMLCTYNIYTYAHTYADNVTLVPPLSISLFFPSLRPSINSSHPLFPLRLRIENTEMLFSTHLRRSPLSSGDFSKTKVRLTCGGRNTDVFCFSPVCLGRDKQDTSQVFGGLFCIIFSIKHPQFARA